MNGFASRLVRGLFVGLPERAPVFHAPAARFLRWAANCEQFSPRARGRLREFYEMRMRGRSCVLALQDGFTMELVGDDVIQSQIMLYGPYRQHVWEPNTVRLIKHLAASGRQFLVAGGHVGYFPLLIAKNAATSGAVIHTFEPNDDQRAQLLRNVEANGFSNIKVDPRALSDQSGMELEFFSDNINVCSSLVTRGSNGQTKRVVSVTIEDYCASQNLTGLDLIVLDIEGAEPEALRGAWKFLNRGAEQSADLIFELVPDRRPRDLQDALLADLNSKGYDLYVIEDAADRAVASGGAVRLFPLRGGGVERVQQLRAALGLSDPNVFASKRGLDRLRPVAVVA